MYFKLPSFISSLGASLIASNTLWFTNSKLDNLNSYGEEEKVVSSGISQTKTNYETKTEEQNPPYTFFRLKEQGTNKQYNLYKPSWNIDKFTLDFSATIEDYGKVDVEDISISLFTNEAWNSTSHRDEYSKNLTKEEVKQLFDNTDPRDYRTKQLLLSLSKRRYWEYLGNTTPVPVTYWAHHAPVKAKKVEDLKDLKIKYFKDFDSLKSYVQAKVKTCITPKRSCVAKVSELTFIEQDEMSFFS